MKTLWLDCGMGAAGDMLTAALLELLPEPDSFVDELNALGLPGVFYRRERAVKCGIAGTHMSVLIHGTEANETGQEPLPRPDGHHHEHEHHHEHKHHHGHDHGHTHADMAGIRQVLQGLAVTERVRGEIEAVYELIAAAEAKVHGVPVEEIHFHEVGSLDAIADVTAVCLLMDRLRPDEVVVSPVHVGCGQVRCAHGILSVPAPAAAELLRGVPIYGGAIEGELCTPTGAALLRHFATRFGDMPVMVPEAIGYGMGKKDFPRANCLRAMLGRTRGRTDTVTVLSCNVDDMTAEELGHALERLLEAGAREAYTLPAGMKKSRPGTLLQVICDTSAREEMARLLFRHTTTLGVRWQEAGRYVLDRQTRERATSAGPVRVKAASGWGVTRQKAEYEDLARIARERNISLREARKLTEVD